MNLIYNNTFLCGTQCSWWRQIKYIPNRLRMSTIVIYRYIDFRRVIWVNVSAGKVKWIVSMLNCAWRMEPAIGIFTYLILIFIHLNHNISLLLLFKKWIHFSVGKAFNCQCVRENTLKCIAFAVNEILIMLVTTVLCYQTHNSQVLPLIREMEVYLHELIHAVSSPTSRWAQNAEASGGSVSQMLLMEFAPVMSTILYLRNTPVCIP